MSAAAATPAPQENPDAIKVQLEIEKLRLETAKLRLEAAKLPEDIEKTKLESKQLRRPFWLTPQTWIAAVAIVGLLLQAISSHYSAREAVIAKEQAVLDSTKANQEKEKAIQEKEKAVQEKQNAELSAQQARIVMEKYEKQAGEYKADIALLSKQKEELVKILPTKVTTSEPPKDAVVVEGVIYDLNGSPLPAVSVSLFSSGHSELLATAITDAGGRFSVRVQKSTSPLTIVFQKSGYPTKVISDLLPTKDLSVNASLGIISGAAISTHD